MAVRVWVRVLGIDLRKTKIKTHNSMLLEPRHRESFCPRVEAAVDALGLGYS